MFELISLCSALGMFFKDMFVLYVPLRDLCCSAQKQRKSRMHRISMTTRQEQKVRVMVHGLGMFMVQSIPLTRIEPRSLFVSTMEMSRAYCLIKNLLPQVGMTQEFCCRVCDAIRRKKRTHWWSGQSSREVTWRSQWRCESHVSFVSSWNNVAT